MTSQRKHKRFTIPGNKGMNLTDEVKGEGDTQDITFTLDAPKELHPNAKKTKWIPCLIFRVKKIKKWFIFHKSGYSYAFPKREAIQKKG